jgi:transposase
MIDYETYLQIHTLKKEQKLKPPQIAETLKLNIKTVQKWIKTPRYQPRKTSLKTSKLDPYKSRIQDLLDRHSYSAQQLFQLIGETGYTGSYSLVKKYVRRLRKPRKEAFFSLRFAPGECAQVDWGHCGTITVGNTKRNLSVFIMVLCYSRLMYVELTLSEKLEHFLQCHRNAFEYFGGVPEQVMVDNCKTAVLHNLPNQNVQLNPQYADFARHYNFTIKPCAVRRPNQKGRVENAVGYFKKNFIQARQFESFCALQNQVKIWLEKVANCRNHGQTKKQPRQLFEHEEKKKLIPLPILPYECSVPQTVRISSTFRIRVDTNTYSVPSAYAGLQLSMLRYVDRLCVYNHDNKLIADHPRSYERHRDFENPQHVQQLLKERKQARARQSIGQFLKITPAAELYYHGLRNHRFDALKHIRKILALLPIYSSESIASAIQEALTLEAFGADYIAIMLEQRTRVLPDPGILHLTRKEDLLHLQLPLPNLDLYHTKEKEDNHHEKKE